MSDRGPRAFETDGGAANVLEHRVDPTDWPAAVADIAGPQLVVAGPGAGKTEFLVRRAAHLLNSDAARAAELVVLTFSRRAADRLRRRILDAVGGSPDPLEVSTFHSFAFRMMEARLAARGAGAMPSLLTGPEQVALVGTLLHDEDPSGWPLPSRGLLGTSTFAEEVADFLLRCRERLIGPERLEDMAFDRPDWRALPGFFRRYEERLRREHRIDYGGLLATAVDALEDPVSGATVAAPWCYVLVDEYQDTSPAQVRLLELLVAGHRNLTAAADPYQSVYSFRGAELRSVAEFPTRFPDLDGRPARRLVLTTSFRVPAPILEAALRVTSSGDLPGAAGPVVPAPHPGSVEAYVFDQESAEAEWIAGEIARLHLEEAIPYAAMAVLVRSKRRFVPELSRALHRRGVPHDQPDRRLVDHPVVRLVLDLARIAGRDARPEGGESDETDRVMRRILLGPLFSMPIGEERALLRARRVTARPWSEIIRGHLPRANGLADLLADGTWATDLPAVDGFWTAWQGLEQFERIAVDPAASGERAALAAFSQALERQAERDARLSLREYARLSEEDDFEATPLLSFRGERGDRLVLTTLHQAKGLEFEVVVVADAVEGVFPDVRRTRSFLRPHLLGRPAESGAASISRFRLQEEMRLAYTATTRARRRLVWTATAAAIDEGERRPSRFLLAVAGVESSDVLGPGAERTGPPITPAESEAHLRRLLADPTVPAASRLAAVSVLAKPPAGTAWDPLRFAGVAGRGDDTGLVEPGTGLSPSQAEAYEDCPRRYALERRLGAVESSSPYARFGSLVHRVLEEAERAAASVGRSHATLDEARAHARRVWAEEAAFGSPVLDEAWLARAERLLERLFAEWPEDSLDPVALERWLELTVDGVRWSGRADRIERYRPAGLRVVDYKTGASSPGVAKAAASLQLGFYLLASREDPELRELGTADAAEMWHPLIKEGRWRFPFDPGHLPGVKARMREAAAGIQSEAWPARVGAACRTCEVRLVCDAWPEGREGFVA
ncbi:MAG: ATP-dependent DNA helicase [Acidimicrobiia bacterium]